METALRSAFLDVWSSHSLCKTGELHGLLYGCLGRRGMPAGIPGAGHEDAQRSLPVAPAVVVDYTPAVRSAFSGPPHRRRYPPYYSKQSSAKLLCSPQLLGAASLCSHAGWAWAHGGHGSRARTSHSSSP